MYGITTAALLLSVAFAFANAPARAQSAAPAAPQPTKIKRTEIVAADNWTITCVTPDRPAPKRTCTADLKIFQTDAATNTARPVFSWILGRDGAKPLSVVAVPTGVLIAPGIVLKVGDRRPKALAFVQCQPDRCEAELDIDDDLAKALSSQSAAEFSATGATGAVAKFNVNLKGFEDAWAAVTKSGG